MEFIIDNYGKAIAIFLAVVGLCAVLAFLLKASPDGIVMQQFQKLIDTFFSSVQP